MSTRRNAGTSPPSHFLIYKAEDGRLKIDVRFEGETVWLTQQRMAALFQTTKQNIGQHLRNIFAEGELAPDSVVKDFFTTAADGKKYRVRFYNLDAIISVGYLTHALLGLGDFHALAAHPAVGASWEGFAIETLLAAAPWMSLPSYYRTSNGAEVDLVLDLPGRRDPWAIEIKRGSAPKVSRGFANACADLGAERAFVVHGGRHRYPMGDGVEAIGLPEMAALLRDW